MTSTISVHRILSMKSSRVPAADGVLRTTVATLLPPGEKTNVVASVFPQNQGYTCRPDESQALRTVCGTVPGGVAAVPGDASPGLRRPSAHLGRVRQAPPGYI